MNRAERRHQEQRAKARARRMLAETWRRPELVEPVIVGRFAATPKPCSCVMCGNAREVEGPPVSEKRRAGEPPGTLVDRFYGPVGTHGHQPFG